MSKIRRSLSAALHAAWLFLLPVCSADFVKYTWVSEVDFPRFNLNLSQRATGELWFFVSNGLVSYLPYYSAWDPDGPGIRIPQVLAGGLQGLQGFQSDLPRANEALHSTGLTPAQMPAEFNEENNLWENDPTAPQFDPSSNDFATRQKGQYQRQVLSTVHNNGRVDLWNGENLGFVAPSGNFLIETGQWEKAVGSGPGGEFLAVPDADDTAVLLSLSFVALALVHRKIPHLTVR